MILTATIGRRDNMINITSVVKHIEGFDRNDFIFHRREQALLTRKNKQTPQGWFNSKGQFIAKTAEGAIQKLGLINSYEQVKCNTFYVVDPDEITPPDTTILVDVHGVMIGGMYLEPEVPADE